MKGGNIPLLLSYALVAFFFLVQGVIWYFKRLRAILFEH